VGLRWRKQGQPRDPFFFPARFANLLKKMGKNQQLVRGEQHSFTKTEKITQILLFKLIRVHLFRSIFSIGLFLSIARDSISDVLR
jgi:hypothetical protein